MQKRFLVFVLLFFVIIIGYPLLVQHFFPSPPPGPAAQAPLPGAAEKIAQGGPKKEAAAGPGKPAAGEVSAAPGEKPAAKAAPSPPAGVKPAGKLPGAVEPARVGPATYWTLGSLAPTGGTRMLVTITSRGAAVERIELNSPRYREQEDRESQEDRGGYLGHLVPTDDPAGGARLQVVGAGTPAADAGLQPGDVIVAIGPLDQIHGAADLEPKLARFAPGEKISLSVRRAGAKPRPFSATLAPRPLELIRPEWETRPVAVLTPGKHDPLSLLLTLSKIGDQQIRPDEEEIAGLGLLDGNWEMPAEKRSFDSVELLRRLPQYKLTVIKRYRLAKVPPDAIHDDGYRAYHLTLDIEIHRDADTPLEVAYRLDGPNGLPTEGWWYLNKIGRSMGGAGVRDVALHFVGRGPDLMGCSSIVSAAAKDKLEPWDLKSVPADPQSKLMPLGYIGVDTQYFSAILIPQKPINDLWHNRVEPRLVGAVPKESARTRLANVSCRITSDPIVVTRDQPLKHTYVMFAGPKDRRLLAQYGPPNALDEINLSELIYYGWPIWGWFAEPLSYVLHFFAKLGNYGLAIVLLTVMVRMCMFPLSRKQALGAQKMQTLQPEMKRLTEKYKKDMEKRSKALQELYKKHNYSPLSGCLPMFIQLPIFYGLYRCLMNDINLRQAPLITESLGWCTNLAAPDMLWRWSAYMPPMVINFLGPYLNILPLLTVVLFIWQQKMFMPPAADENAALQQKMMQYMMVFMGFMFFRVPSGLCIYFIASSLWGIGERKLLPKTTPPATEGDAATRPAEPTPTSNGNPDTPARRRRKQRGKN